MKKSHTITAAAIAAAVIIILSITTITGCNSKKAIALEFQNYKTVSENTIEQQTGTIAAQNGQIDRQTTIIHTDSVKLAAYSAGVGQINGLTVQYYTQISNLINNMPK